MAVTSRARRWRALYGGSLALFVVCLLPITAWGEGGPRPPCGGEPDPPYASAGDPPRLQIWWPVSLPSPWTPPSCLGWSPAPANFLVAAAGRFQTQNDADALLARFGAISESLNVRYWSASEARWKNLLETAAALDGPDLRRPRADFTAEEMKTGASLYFAQKDSRSSTEVIHRLRVQEFGANRIVLGIENVTSVWVYLFQIYVPGDLQSVHFLTRRSPTEWEYYSLSRARGGVSVFMPAYDAPYINRAVALFRHIAGLRTDQGPPPAR